MLKIYDQNKTEIEYLYSYWDCKKESTLSDNVVNKSLSFTTDQKIGIEYYICSEQDEYVVKEINEKEPKKKEVVAELNLEELEGTAFSTYSVENYTMFECVSYLMLKVDGWGYDIGSELESTDTRSFSLSKTDALAVIKKICEVFLCEALFDTINRKVRFYREVGEDNGVRFLKGLNMTDIKKESDSYDFYTRLYPIGADDLTIAEVNGGIPYLEDFTYSTKVKTLVWEDTNYTDAQALKDDAEYKLSEISKPVVSYTISIIDLAAVYPEDYGDFSFGIGDTVTISDPDLGIEEAQRIMKYVEYPEKPEKNTCEISNRRLSFSDMQKKLLAAAAAAETVTNGNIVIGSKVSGLKASQIEGMEVYYTEPISNITIDGICR